MLLYADTNYWYDNIKRILDIDFPDLSSLKHHCSNCTKERKKNRVLKTCSRCRSVEYCSDDCYKAHWKSHKRYCVAPEESAALIAAEYMNFAFYTEEEREKVVEAAEQAFTICRFNRVRTLTLLRVMRHYLLLVNRLHITVADIVRVFGVPTESATVITDIAVLLGREEGIVQFVANKRLQIDTLRCFRDSKCVRLRDALVLSKFYLQNENIAKLEQQLWKYVSTAADDFCRTTLVQWLELISEFASVASVDVEEFFGGIVTLGTVEKEEVDINSSPFGNSISWTDYINYLWWELAWIMESTDGRIIAPNLRDAALIKDFNDGEDEAAVDDPEYQRDELPSMNELRTNFYEYFKNEAREFRYHCLNTQCWEGPYTWLPAHMCDKSVAHADHHEVGNGDMVEQVLVLGKLYKGKSNGETGRTELFYIPVES